MIFILTLVVSALGVACFNNLLFISIQEGQWLGDWQKMIRKFDINGKFFWYKTLGGCQVCTFHFLTLCSWVLFSFLHSEIGWMLFFWYFIYTPIATILSLLIYKSLNK